MNKRSRLDTLHTSPARRRVRRLPPQQEQRIMNGSIQENRATIGSADELRTIKKEPMYGKTGRTPPFSAQNNCTHMGT